MGRRKHKPRKPRISSEIPASSSSASPLDAPSSSATPPPPPPWIELPGDVTANILRRLGCAGMLGTAQRVCMTWWKVCQDPAMWRVIHLRNPEQRLKELHGDWCRRAVDLSQGQLIELSIENFGDYELIDYVVNRASNLKSLTFRGCRDIYGNHLTRAVEKLPELEELHLTNMAIVGFDEVRTIGLACPNLKSFSYNGRGLKHPRKRHVGFEDIADEFNHCDYALAISTSMPNLQHLRLFSQRIPNKSLEAILDACPHLESLDIRQCYDLDLSGDLGKRCREQIKDVRLPLDSASDIQHLVGGPSDWADNYHDIFDDDGLFDDSSDDDYYCGYEDYEDYDDYFAPLGHGFFGDDGFFDIDDIGRLVDRDDYF